MNLREFKEFLEDYNDTDISRSKLIDKLIGIQEDWSYILRAFLILSDDKTISISYLYGKVEFMERKPKNMHEFMDYAGINIYTQLKKYLKHRKWDKLT